MRMLFIADALEPTSGSASKIVAMATEWERRGHRVWLTTTRKPSVLHLSEVVPRMRLPDPLGPRRLPERIRGELSVQLLYPQLFARACARLGLDLIYCRGLPWAPGLRALMRDIPFMLEINGDVRREIKKPLRRMSRLRARALQLRNADGVVFVSRELERECSPKPERSLVLANPCLPSAASPVSCERPARPRLVLIGHAKRGWGGLDKVPALASALPELDFVVIGTELAGPPNLRSYPMLTQTEADRVMSECTVGIGSLGLHRLRMQEASPLKSRNYLALGLPIIQAYEDTDLSEADGCILQLPNTEDNVARHAERIREFAWRAHRDPTLSARALALARGRLSLQAKEGERLAFIEQCVRARRAALAERSSE